MTRTTPLRLDIAGDIPALASWARNVTRLHPRAGAPTMHDSSVGGPLLWPADEPWPTCPQPYFASPPLTTLADIRTQRALLTDAWSRSAAGQDFMTPHEREMVDRLRAGTLNVLPSGPSALIPLAQLYARDAPALSFPEGTDLLQVLWAASRGLEGCSSEIQLRWRASGDVEDVLMSPPEPAFVEASEHVPEPCVLRPEQVFEYPPGHLLDGELEQQANEWSKTNGFGYWDFYAVAPGWKAGGWPAGFTFRDPPDPEEQECGECGGPVDALLTVGSGEWDGATGHWCPIEDGEDAEKPVGYPYRSALDPTMVTIGRGYTLQLYYCLNSPEHLPRTIVQ